MLRLSGRIDPITKQAGTCDALFTITSDPFLPAPIRNRFALLSQHPVDVAGYGVQLVYRAGQEGKTAVTAEDTIYRLPSHFNYLQSGDIVSIDNRRDFLHTLFRKDSRHNSILLTEQCNHYCLMCSQPPKKTDDSHLLQKTL
jgi:hypothetical protein